MKHKYVILDSIRSLQNVGAIFRNADGAGFEKLYLCGYTPIPPRSDISKTALGAENMVDWEYFGDVKEVICFLKQEGYLVYALEIGENAKDFREFYSENIEKVCIILGNEVSGIQNDVLSLCDGIIMIPMLGEKSSLNVSVAAGIAMYAFL